MRSLLFPRASVLTPNLPEAELLLGRRIADIGAMREAASALLATGAGAVLLKGGHLAGDRIADVLATGTGITVFEGRRITRRGTHGTGCTLASAVATGLGLGQELQTAVARARAYVAGAIRAAPGFGAGNGPLGHLAAGGFSV
jgi:hydroxymethylpyrimidine/phosphomethylpyrimidine kinase